jgi:hypothetical protein
MANIRAIDMLFLDDLFEMGGDTYCNSRQDIRQLFR